MVEEINQTWNGKQVYKKKAENGENKYKHIKKDCLQCGEEFYAALTQCRKGKGNFCSKSCSGKHQAENRDQTGEKNPNWKGGMADNQKRYEANKEEYKERARKSVQEKREWFKDYKSDKECEECGEDHPACIDFHHENPEDKDKNVSRLVHDNHKISRIKEEIEKCKVLCANCHRKQHN